MFVSKILISSFKIIHYTVVENIFVVQLTGTQYRISKCHVNDCSKIKVKQIIKIPGKGEYVKFKNFKKKIRSLFMIYTDFDVNLVSNDKGKQNPDDT